MNISEKLFTYIDNHSDLTVEMINQYKNSLIFLGDEQQIFQPLTGSYVGIGKSRFEEAIARLADNTAALSALDAHIHDNVVNSIWVATNEEHFDAIFKDSNVPHKVIAGQNAGVDGLGQGQSNYLMTNQDIVIRGLFDTNGTSALSTDEFGYGYDADFNAETGTYTYNGRLWNHINRSKADNSNFKGSSGIQVNIVHTGEYKSGTYEGLDFAYWEGHDYLTIDDSYTWAYITNQSSYIMEYSKKVAIAQANRVYHDILGGNETVYIEKSFNEVFTFDDDDKLVPIVNDETGDLDVVNIHLKDGSYQEVFIHNEGGHYYIWAPFTDADTGDNYYYIVKTDDTSSTISKTADDGTGTTVTITKPTTEQLKNLLDQFDGWDRDNNNNFVEVAWYHMDAEATAQAQINLANGIQTFKEVTYVLDQITDGSDAGIKLTYNIAQNTIDINDLKNWKNSIGENVVTDFYASTPNGSFAIVNSYSVNKWDSNDAPAIGETRLDIDLLTAQTYTLNGSTYAAYLSSHASQIQPIWRYMGDTTNSDYYYDLSDANTDKAQLVANLTEALGIDPDASNTIDIYTQVGTNDNPEYIRSGSQTSINGISTLSSGFILFNYKKFNYPTTNNGAIIDGLTTVNWVTTYVGWGIANALSSVTNFTDNTKAEILTYIHENMTVTYTDKAGQYVSHVSQEDGKISVEYKNIPLDKILASQEVYGNDFFIEITPNEALVLSNNGQDFSNIYYNNAGNYQHPSNIDDSGNTHYYLIATTNRFTKVNIPTLTDENDPEELMPITYALIANDGGYTYFQKVGTGNIVDSSNPIMKYIPVDINELLDTGNLTYLGKSTLDSLYYYNGSNPSSKYIDVAFRKNTEDGSTEIHITSYVTYLGAATPSNTGLADAYDVRHTIETMFSWIDLKTNQFLK